MAPIFDNNRSLFAGAIPDELDVGAMLEKTASGRGAFDPSLDERAGPVIGYVQKEQVTRLAGFEFERHRAMGSFSADDGRNYFGSERLNVLGAYARRRAKTLLSLPNVDPEKT